MSKPEVTAAWKKVTVGRNLEWNQTHLESELIWVTPAIINHLSCIIVYYRVKTC